jgi:hypothetical protein
MNPNIIYYKTSSGTVIPPQNIMRQFSMVFSSDPATGAINISNSSLDAGSRFSVNLPYPISIPVHAKACELHVSEFLGWWTMLNIFLNINDTFILYISGQQYKCIIPPGIYNLSNLSAAIARSYSNIITDPSANPPTVAPTIPFPITFLSDDSTQRVILLFTIANVYVDFTVSRSMRNILGFYGSNNVYVKNGADPQDFVPANQASFINQSIIANQVAQFNIINSLLINCAELSQGGIPTNTTSLNSIANPKIQTPVGSQIIYEPYNPPTVNADFLIGKKISNLNFSLTDQSGNPVNTNGEMWSCNVSFKYWI